MLMDVCHVDASLESGVTSQNKGRSVRTETRRNHFTQELESLELFALESCGDSIKNK